LFDLKNVSHKWEVSSFTQRAALRLCFMREGDVLVVTKARSTCTFDRGTADHRRRRAEPGIRLIVLSTGGERLDTRNPTSMLMLTILATVATWEREIMLERQREGITKAIAEGNAEAVSQPSCAKWRRSGRCVQRNITSEDRP
jgi:DNA invertase Pin-like site-specific DNA recombinase